MAIYRYGTFTQPTKGGSAIYYLNLGFVPSTLRIKDITAIDTVSPMTGVFEGYFSQTLSGLSTPTSLLYTYTAGVAAASLSTTNGILAFQSTDDNLFTPQQAPYTTVTGDRAYIRRSTNQVIATTGNISQAANALVTTGDAHSFTTSDIGVTVVTFHGVPGMTQINLLSGVITSVPSTTTFTVNINTSNFSAYSSSGVTQGVNSGFFNVITGAPVDTLYSNTLLPTAEANLGFIGVSIGSDFMNGTGTNTSDIWEYEAILQSPATGP